MALIDLFAYYLCLLLIVCTALWYFPLLVRALYKYLVLLLLHFAHCFHIKQSPGSEPRAGDGAQAEVFKKLLVTPL